jgi:hypothetical protein
MAIKKIGSPDPKYLAATDILIGDMSDINYEFLLYSRPVILLANKWLRENFPDIGIKTDLASLKDAILRSIQDPEEYSENRKHWLDKTMYKPDGCSSDRLIDIVLEYSRINDPFILLIHGDNEVLKTHLDSLYEAIKKRNIEMDYVNFFDIDKYGKKKNLICISPNNMLIKDIINSYNVHIDHGVKGPGTTDLQSLVNQYRERNYYPNVNLHITEGEASLEKTKIILGPDNRKAVMVGYPKSDLLISLNTEDNKKSVCTEFGFDCKKLLITYAPAGKCSYPWKQGASLSDEALNKLKDISREIDVNILIKLKFESKSIIKKIFNKFKDTISLNL